MFEKVNPAHPDKIADRIAGAIVDLAYKQEQLVLPEFVKDSVPPRIAVEVLVGHGHCRVVIETGLMLNEWDICTIIRRISGIEAGGCDILQVKQDEHLAENQKGKIRCGDNGIFLGVPVGEEEEMLTKIARSLYHVSKESDGKYILDVARNKLIVCQSNLKEMIIRPMLAKYKKDMIINPLGDWTGGLQVDTGATNRKLGSDMGRAVTGGGLHGKDLSKADVSVNIYCHLKAQATGVPVMMCCAIGDEVVDGIPYQEIVDTARDYIKTIGGFEKFAEWGLIR